MDSEVQDYPPARQDDAFVTVWSFASIAYSIYMIWMLYDAYRRYGMHYWLFVIFFFQPLGAIVYGLLHARFILHGLTAGGGDGPGLFGLGLKSKIARAEQQMKVAETEALRAELALLYYQARRYGESEALLKKVLAADAENQEALYYLALCRLDQQDPEGGCALLKRLMEQNKKYRFGVAWLRYAEALDALGKREEALEEFRLLSRNFPRPLTEFAYAKKLADAGQKEKAREVLEYMLSTSAEAPAEDRTWLGQGRSLLRGL
ncbi:MAG: tetratricopeptide repeat protein [Planctomycetota bacterium]|nr:tetratricopeptide repeat protein [Planctomycetota bacterium]